MAVNAVMLLFVELFSNVELSVFEHVEENFISFFYYFVRQLSTQNMSIFVKSDANLLFKM